MKLNPADIQTMIAASETAKRNPMRPPDSLPRTAGAAIGVFMRHPSGWLISLFAIIGFAVRLSWGPLGWGDAAVSVAIVAYFPINEWLIHVFLLHYKPVTILGRKIDFLLPKTHRQHHADPWNLELVFIPRHIHWLTPLSVSLLMWALWPWKELALTGITTYLLLGLHYEWVHYLAHIPWCPPIAHYQRRVREHRYHHFRNENFWWGVSMGTADRLFGTAPAVEDTARSGTTSTVGQ